jgi:hypothetical protein
VATTGPGPDPISPETQRLLDALEAREARAERRAERAYQKALADRAFLDAHPDRWCVPASAYASTFRRATITPAILAKAPASPKPLGIPATPRRPRMNSRYWLVGLYVIEEDRDGWTWVLTRSDLTSLDAGDVIREIQPGQHLPITHVHDAENPVFDALLVAIEKVIAMWPAVPG